MLQSGRGYGCTPLVGQTLASLLLDRSANLMPRVRHHATAIKCNLEDLAPPPSPPFAKVTFYLVLSLQRSRRHVQLGRQQVQSQLRACSKNVVNNNRKAANPTLRRR